MTTPTESATLFGSLHVPGRPLVLPNAWDVARARLVEQAGAPVIATTSAGVAWSLGALTAIFSAVIALRISSRASWPPSRSR